MRIRRAELFLQKALAVRRRASKFLIEVLATISEVLATASALYS